MFDGDYKRIWNKVLKRAGDWTVLGFDRDGSVLGEMDVEVEDDCGEEMGRVTVIVCYTEKTGDIDIAPKTQEEVRRVERQLEISGTQRHGISDLLSP